MTHLFKSHKKCSENAQIYEIIYFVYIKCNVFFNPGPQNRISHTALIVAIANNTL